MCETGQRITRNPHRDGESLAVQRRAHGDTYPLNEFGHFRESIAPCQASRDCVPRQFQALDHDVAHLGSTAAIVHAVFLERVSVQLDAEPGRVGQRDHAVDDRQVLDQQLAAERRLGELDGQELDVRAAVAGRGEMCARGDPDPALPAVRDDQAIAVGGDPADPQCLGETTDAADVRLKHVELTAVGEVEKLEARVLPLAGGDPDRRPVMEKGIALQVIDVDRRLDEIRGRTEPAAR